MTGRPLPPVEITYLPRSVRHKGAGAAEAMIAVGARKMRDPRDRDAWLVPYADAERVAAFLVAHGRQVRVALLLPEAVNGG